ncbi:uncharacterized protein SPPG_00281 [Spizellomyces punctatus DAOM BR117]|uniref:Uncharacterized protein n=1 Tax=Spizellomyces punctatus (strain DAOM BR117) TaxID=645134 RepID=A0A0L0HTY8_SPIPD|nr:uncharacterized protein SPPG_00281 [Spizellomyces punctatus DAOM BR117]KND04557.1 hypothetical protein SPPG_00281 [Spizellomyces punctatus DAOM BR117]|eukprot:XP_016612596.1 hypothetical protein SPPG_00281 [Spizellomyces punctatus DAOM BR117]
MHASPRKSRRFALPTHPQATDVADAVTVVSHTGSLLVAGTIDGRVVAWDVHTGQLVCSIPSYSEKQTMVTCLFGIGIPGFERCFAGKADGTVSEYDLQSGQLVSTCGYYESRVRCLTYDVRARKLLVGTGEGRVAEVDVRKHNPGRVGRYLEKFPQQEIGAMCFHKGRLYIAVGCTIVCRPNSTRSTYPLQHAAIIDAMCIAMGDKNFLCSAARDGSICLWRFSGQDLICVASAFARSPSAIKQVSLLRMNLTWDESRERLYSLRHDGIVNEWKIGVTSNEDSKVALSCTSTYMTRQCHAEQIYSRFSPSLPPPPICSAVGRLFTKDTGCVVELEHVNRQPLDWSGKEQEESINDVLNAQVRVDGGVLDAQVRVSLDDDKTPVRVSLEDDGEHQYVFISARIKD